MPKEKFTIKRGQIFLNRWAGYKTLFVYLNTSGRLANGICFVTVNGKTIIRKGQYYRQDLADANYFPKVGFIDIRKMWETALQNGITDNELIDKEYDSITGHTISKSDKDAE